MDLQIVITLFSSVLQATLAYWGYKLTVDPIETPKQRRWYRAGFIAIGVLGVVLTATQQWMNGREQAELLAKIDGLGTGVEQVRSQTQQPPNITVNVPPPQVISQSPDRRGGPLPRYMLTDAKYGMGSNDPGWFKSGEHSVSLDWSELNGIDVFAEVYLWATECDSALARIFDLTTNSPAVTGPRLAAIPLAKFPDECKPVFQRLKLPRATGTHLYRLETSITSVGNGNITAIGEIVLRWQ